MKNNNNFTTKKINLLRISDTSSNNTYYIHEKSGLIFSPSFIVVGKSISDCNFECGGSTLNADDVKKCQDLNFKYSKSCVIGSKDFDYERDKAEIDLTKEEEKYDIYEYNYYEEDRSFYNGDYENYEDDPNNWDGDDLIGFR